MAEIKLSSLVIVTVSIVNFATTQEVLVGTKWNKRTKNFESIPGLQTYEAERQNIVLQSRQRETHNFKGAPINITYFEDKGFFEFRDNDTRVTGIVGDIWTILSHFLNFTNLMLNRLVLTNDKGGTVGVSNPDGTYTGIVEYARLNQTDVVPKMPVYVTRLGALTFAPVMWMNSQRIFAYGEWTSNPAWMVSLFSGQVWIFIVIFIAIFSVASIVSARILTIHRGRQFEPSSIYDHLFFTLATVYNQGSTCAYTGSGSKILTFSIAVFSFLTLAVYNSRLIYSMSSESFSAPFDDLEGLLEKTKLHLVVLNNSVAQSTVLSQYAFAIFHRIRESKRYTVANSLNELYDKVCQYSDKYVMFDAEDAVQTRTNMQCPVMPVGSRYYWIPVAAGISKRVIYKKAIDIGFIKLREYGLLDGIKKRYMLSQFEKGAIRQSNTMAIGTDRVSLIFGILCLGMIASIIMCTIENIIFTLKKPETIRYINKKLAKMRRRIHLNFMPHSHGRND